MCATVRMHECMSVSWHRSICANDTRAVSLYFSHIQCADFERQTGRYEKQVEKQENDNKGEH